MDYYQTLGVAENADQETIKQAYKKLAMKNHPDRGGDTQKFQSISQAYDTLSDPQKKQRYDAERNGQHVHINMGGGPFGQHPFSDVFNQFGFSFGPGFQQHNVRRNKDLTIRVSVSTKQSYTGTQLEAKFNTLTGRSQTVVVDVPAGVMNGQTIRYEGLGDDSVPGIAKGNLNVTVVVEEDPNWSRRGHDLITFLKISVVDAMFGCQRQVDCLDGTAMNINLRPGVTHGTEYASGGRGFRDLQSGYIGNFTIVVNIDIPAVADNSLKSQFEDLYAKIS